MKIIHTADIHLGSKMESRMPRDKAKERRLEIRKTFSDMIEYAHENGVGVIMLCGDVFDSDRPSESERAFFYNAVKRYSDIDFLYLRGNHDAEVGYDDEIENLKMFSDSWSYLSYDDGKTVIAGAEITNINKRSLYNTLSLDKNKLNIVMLHGQVVESNEESSTPSEEYIPLSCVRDKGINYLALGHIHLRGEKKLDTEGIYVYCGCLEGRGFDECGKKGFCLLETDAAVGKIKLEFIPFAKREIREITVDVSQCHSIFAAQEKVIDAIDNREDIYRIHVVGETEFDTSSLADTVVEGGNAKCFFCEVADETQPRISPDDYDDDMSLKGEFIRIVNSDTTLDDYLKHRIIREGVRAIDGGTVK
ncbi:MAG: DNA repair exonuclease [Eubacteriales bacterium]|nr:DNA repair exonuclease [Eubacteriales bacterium]